ncbi:MAG: DinB family protein [Chloroflexi bacterium]|nr:DinB family protein [Chloroflexota bacterium]
MNAVELLRQQVQTGHWLLEETVKDVTPEQAHWTPPGMAHPISALYAHTVMGEDMLVNGMLRGAAPLAMGEWAGKAGVSVPPPQEGDWSAWARSVRVDLDALRAYAQAVYTATDAYLSTLTEQDLDRQIDLSGFALGQQSLGWVLSNIVGSHLNLHGGEISALKGAQGARGYPF